MQEDMHRTWRINLTRAMAQHIVGYDETGAPIRGLTAKRLAEESGIDPSTISRTLNGEMMFSDTKKELVCGVLGKYLDEVFPWSSDLPPHPTAHVAEAVPPKVARAAVPSKRTRRKTAA